MLSKLGKILPWKQSKHHWSDSNQLGVNKRMEIKGTNNQVVIGSGTNIYNLQIVIYGNNNTLIIGENCVVGGFLEMFGNGNEITIGTQTLAAHTRLIAHGGKYIRIGEKCLIAGSTDIRTTDSHSILNAEGERINPDESIEIGDRVWIAREVMILKGTVIGSDSVIGARSVVTKKVPSNVVAVGIPARVVRTNISWLIESI
ncbi:MAG: acyltransferase [Cylindrospermopsis raciborskii KL1]|jgi:acetyltransferase-like isoleucine patch superfamily enzyme|uniref:acyltransferase n=1 Tax=Cylindrospermopsis raciborskii TaxID=77022 RepID=UPI001A213DFE|nr:acyltransferase [Cylindrospermopsis raciborskii]MBG0742672.1 acyltransferase [Cylindrospermopsis raciborskii KL1]